MRINYSQCLIYAVNMKDQLVIGTRRSVLALWQSSFIREALQAAFPGLRIELKYIITTGDKTQDSNASIPSIGGKGLFTAELEEALVQQEIDLAVHSLKDLPTTLAAEFVLGAITARGQVADVLISSSGKRLSELPAGAVIGTSSLRRSSQILRMRPDLAPLLIRGNVDTRINKVRAHGGKYDAIVLAHAGIARLGLESQITQVFTDEEMLPAPGQGALTVECRANDSELLQMLTKLHDPLTAAAVTAERSFLSELGAGCNTPVAAHAVIETRGVAQYVVFKGRCLSHDGGNVVEVMGEALLGSETQLGERMAHEVMARGFKRLCAA